MPTALCCNILAEIYLKNDSKKWLN